MLQLNVIQHSQLFNNMGLAQIKETIIGSNNYYSYDQIKQKIKELNQEFKEAAPKLHFIIHLKYSELKYDHADWLKSLVPGVIQINHSINNQSSNFCQEQGNINQNSGTIKQYIVFSISDVNNAHEYMKHLSLTKKDLSPKKDYSRNSKQKQKLKQKGKIIEKQITTPQNFLDTPKQNQTSTPTKEQCCICLQKTPSMVLPCSHSFCDNCTVKYIIQAQEKKCPQCRREFVGSRSSVQRSIYTVVQDDQEIYDQIREYLLQLLSNLNSRIVQNIRPFIKQLSKK